MGDPALKEKNNKNKTISNQILHILSLIPNKTEALDFSLLDFNFISNYFQLNKNSAQKFLLQNSKRADFLFDLLRQCKDKNVFLAGKKYYFVKKNVSDNDLRSFIMYSLLAEKTFEIKAEFLLAIAAQESNYNKKAYSSRQHGPFQFTNSTIKDLLNRQNNLKKSFSKNFSDKPMLLNALNKSFDLLKHKNLYNINSAVYLAASLIRIKAMERKIPLDNLKRLAGAYNGGGTKNYSEDVYLRYLFLTGQQQGKIVFFEFQK
jgi:hypothetical protein